MPTLDKKTFTKIQAFNNHAEELIEAEEFSTAIKEYQKAWNSLPEPKQLWEAGLWIKLGQAECSLALNDFKGSKKHLLDAMLCSGAVNNPLVHFLLGVACFETGDMVCARDELTLAHELEGDSIFQDGDEKYRDFLFSGSSN